MNRLLAGIVALFLAAPAVAVAQPNLSNLPANSVVGRTGIGTGPAQAIPFSTFTATVLNNGILLPTINVQTPISRTTLLAAINSAQALGGGIVQIPAGVFSVDTTAGCIPVTGSVTVQGVGAGIGDTGTTLLKANAANDLFCVTSTSFGQIAFRNFGITASVPQNSSTAAIHVIAVTAVTPVVVEGMTINAVYNGIQIDNAPQFYINDNLITSFTGNGVVVAQPNSIDAGVAVISNNKIWDTQGTANGNAGILWHSGSGLRIHNNRILGAFNYGIFIDFTNTFGSDGALLISQNMIEVQKLYGIYMKREAGAGSNTVGQITITGNHLQGLTAGYQNAIGIESSSPSGWVQGASIVGNIIQNGRDDLLNNAVIRIDDGTGITVADNTIVNIGATGGGLRAGTNSSSVLFANNSNIGAGASVRYPTTQSTTTIIDPTGITFANIPSAAKNGSQIYVTDGIAGTPLVGSGSGALAQRINGTWQGLGTPVVPTHQVFTVGANQLYTTPTSPAPLYIRVRTVGAGAGGAGSGTTPGAAVAGGNSCFGTNATACTSPTFQANGGAAAATVFGGAGGTITGCTDGSQGGDGNGALNTTQTMGGQGGASIFGSGGAGGPNGPTAGSAAGPKGAGGGGAGAAGTAAAGGGGGAGGSCEGYISTPAATYHITVGAKGAGGTLGTSGAAGGAGQDGYGIVDEFYQ